MPDKFDYYVQGAMAHREMTHRSNRRARRLFKLAKDEDAAFARAWGFLSYTQIIAYLHDWKIPTMQTTMMSIREQPWLMPT